MISTVASLLGISVGSCLLYISIFLYDDEHGKIQNSLEDWWLRLQDYGDASVGRHIAFSQLLADSLGTRLAKWFGERMCSIRAFAVSSAYSMAALGAVIFLLMLYLFLNQYADRSVAPVAYFAFPAAIVYPGAMLAALVWCILFLRLLRNCTENPRYCQLTLVVTLSAPPIWFFSVWCWYLFVEPPPPTFSLAVRMLLTTAAVLTSVLTDWLLLSTTRFCLRACTGFKSVTMMLVSIGLNIALAVLCVVLPAMIFVGQVDILVGLRGLVDTTELAERLRQPIAFFGALCVLNSTILAPTLLFALAALTLLLHRMLWRLISRPLYLVAEMGVAKRRKACFSVAVALLVPSTTGFSVWGKWLGQLLS
ncbi:MAG: hypothetical protein AAF483_04595 [Planctomycetota bacterium]